MDYNTFTLPNGLRIIHLPSASPVLYCGYGINAGTRDELPGEEGLAHFCEHTTFKGTARRKAWHILNCLERVGGDLNAFTTKEETVYYASILGEHVARAVDLLTDIVFNSCYPQQEIDKEVAVICDEIESYNDSPSELIYDDFENLVFGGHPLGHNILGQAERLHTYTTADALRFTRRFYRPDNAVFFAYGNIDFMRLVSLLRRATAGLEGGTPALDTADTATTLPPYEPQELVVSKGTHQTHVLIGTRTYSVFDQKRMALYLLNNVLGGPGMNARLNLSLREHNGLVYTVDSSMVNYSDTGVWCVYFGCDPHDVNRCRRLVRKELDRLMLHPMSAAQLAAAKKQLKGQVAVAGDNRENFALGFAKSFLHYGWKKDVNRLFEQIDALTADDLQQVANEVFDQRKLTTLMFK
jgi:predicted Zn-dependent peptidase